MTIRSGGAVGMDANGGIRTVWMSDDRVHGYADHYRAIHRAATRCRIWPRGSRTWTAPPGRIGVEMDNYYFSAKAFAVMQAELGDATFVDSTAIW